MFPTCVRQATEGVVKAGVGEAAVWPDFLLGGRVNGIGVALVVEGGICTAGVT